MKSKNIINIINVYAPTSGRVRNSLNENKNVYKNLCKEFDKAPSSFTMLGRDFNSKVDPKLYPKAVLGNVQEADEIRMVQTWWNSLRRIVNSLKTAPSNTLQSTLQPGHKEEQTW